MQIMKTNWGDFMSLLKNWNKYSEIKKRKLYFLFFSISFLLLSFACFGYFYVTGKSFFWIGGAKDGLTQNYNCLIYFSNYLKEIVENVFINHTFVIPQWNFGLGYGADTITTMSIMTIGDIFNWFSVFIPEQFIREFYHIMGFLRLYLAGIVFSCYCMRMKKSYSITLLGSFVYIFSGYALISLPRQVVFINPMIFLPLLLIGVERIFHNEKPYLYILTIAIAIIGSFQYFYIMCIAVIIYAVVRFFQLFNENYLRNIGLYFFKFLVFSIVGIMIGSFIFVPVILRFLSDGRAGASSSFSIFYPLSYYELFFAGMFSYQFPGGDWTFLVYSPIVIFSLITLFISKWKEKIGIKIIFTICLFLLLTPLGGLLMNGFSFSSNRWIFVFSLLLAYIFVDTYESLFSITGKKLALLFFVIICYVLYCFLILGTRIEYSFISLVIIILMTVYLIIVNLFKKIKNKKIFHFISISFFVICGIISNAYFINSEEYRNYPHEFLDYKNSTSVLKESGAKAISQLNDNGFYRFENYDQGLKAFFNSGLNYGIGSPNYFFSLSNPYSQDFYQTMNIGDGSVLYLSHLDNREILENLACIKYIAVSDEKKNLIPETGYQLIQSSQENLEHVNIYENMNVLPLGYTYKNVLSRVEFNQLSLANKHLALQNYLVLEKEKTNKKFETENNFIDYRIIPDKNISYQNGKITVKKKNAKICLKVKTKQKYNNLFVTFENLSFRSIKPNKFYSQSYKRKMSLKDKTYYKFWTPKSSSVMTLNGKISKELIIRNEKDIYYNTNMNDFSVNVYGVNEQGQIEISFSQVGVYHFDNLQIEGLSYQNLDKNKTQLKNNKLENIVIKDNYVEGTINSYGNQFLNISIPYTQGWKAYIDGQETDILRGNIMYMALPLEKGEHKIILKYSTPGLKIGTIVSIFGIVCFIGIVLYEKKKKPMN